MQPQVPTVTPPIPPAPKPPQLSDLKRLLNAIKTLDHKDVVVRAFKTALAAALATLTISHQSYGKEALLVAVAAAGTALLNYVIQLLNA